MSFYVVLVCMGKTKSVILSWFHGTKKYLFKAAIYIFPLPITKTSGTALHDFKNIMNSYRQK